MVGWVFGAAESAIPVGMSDRGRLSRDIQQFAPSGERPNWRGRSDWTSTTVPEIHRAPVYRQPPEPQSPFAPTPSALRARMPVVWPERVPGGTALDGLTQEEADDVPRSGWRELVSRVTGRDVGSVKGRELELRGRIRAPLGSAFPIAVLNLKGGVGKTTVVEALASTFAEARDDRVIAVDLDGGDLSERHGRRSRLSMFDLLNDYSVTRYPDVRAHTYMNSSGLEVLGPPDYAHTNWRAERPDVVKTFSILRKHYSVVVVDCVKALKSSLMEAVLPESQALVVVTGTSIDAIRKTRITLEWLRNNGYQKLVASTVLAINHTAPGGLDILSCKELEEVSAQVAATVVLPFDRHVQLGKEIGLDRLSRKSRRCYLELAAALADLFPGNHLERHLRVVDGHSPSR